MQRQRIARFLPETYRAAITPDNPLGALLAVMEDLHAPVEATLDHLDTYVDPLRAPDDFVFMLTAWLDLDRYLDWAGDRRSAGAPRYAAGLGRLRDLCVEAAELARWRGTRHALERFLEVATGVSGFRIEENPPDAKGKPRPFHITVHAPAAARRFSDLVRRIVDEERPAYATWDVEFAKPSS